MSSQLHARWINLQLIFSLSILLSSIFIYSGCGLSFSPRGEGNESQEPISTANDMNTTSDMTPNPPLITVGVSFDEFFSVLNEGVEENNSVYEDLCRRCVGSEFAMIYCPNVTSPIQEDDAYCIFSTSDEARGRIFNYFKCLERDYMSAFRSCLDSINDCSIDSYNRCITNVSPNGFSCEVISDGDFFHIYSECLDYFICDDYSLINKHFVCDGFYDCNNGSDELAGCSSP